VLTEQHSKGYVFHLAQALDMGVIRMMLLTGWSRCAALYGLLLASAVLAPLAVTAERQTWPTAPVAREGFLEVPGAKLWYWDTGGDGDAVVLLHPMTGSGASWEYQWPALVAKGYRVISYSRRGHFRSDRSSGVPRDASDPPASEDLQRLVDALQLRSFHVVGSALGSFTAGDFAVSRPTGLRSLVLASSMLGIRDPDLLTRTARMIPEGFYRLPADFREIGPWYRAANPEGTARWLEIEKASTGVGRPTAARNLVTLEALGALGLPVLLMTGDADLYMPVPLMQEAARRISNSSFVEIRNSGHAAFWEQPEQFNTALLAFLDRHSRRRP
jgi:pimeloyl-ACP methyl ester carboxylesterase